MSYTLVINEVHDGVMHGSDNSMRHTWLYCIPAMQPHHNGCPSEGWEHPTLRTVSVATDCVPLRNVSAVFTFACNVTR